MGAKAPSPPTLGGDWVVAVVRELHGAYLGKRVEVALLALHQKIKSARGSVTGRAATGIY